MESKSKLIIAALLVVIAVMAGFIIYGYSVGWMVSQQQAAYTIGYQRAIIDVAQQSTNCQTGVPLTIGNQTITLVNVNCQWVANCLQAAQK